MMMLFFQSGGRGAERLTSKQWNETWMSHFNPRKTALFLIYCQTLQDVPAWNNLEFLLSQSSAPRSVIYLLSIVLSYITDYWWSGYSAHSSALKPLELLYKPALKTLHNEPFSSHHCQILKKYSLSRLKPLKYKNVCLVERILCGSGPPLLSCFIIFKMITKRTIKYAAKRKSAIPFRRTTFSQDILLFFFFYIRASHRWESDSFLPLGYLNNCYRGPSHGTYLDKTIPSGYFTDSTAPRFRAGTRQALHHDKVLKNSGMKWSK